MSRVCENCGHRVYRPSFKTERILHQDPVTGYTCQFCSHECVRAWNAKRGEPAAAVVGLVVPAHPGENMSLAGAPAANERPQ